MSWRIHKCKDITYSGSEEQILLKCSYNFIVSLRDQDADSLSCDTQKTKLHLKVHLDYTWKNLINRTKPTSWQGNGYNSLRIGGQASVTVCTSSSHWQRCGEQVWGTHTNFIFDLGGFQAHTQTQLCLSESTCRTRLPKGCIVNC